MAAFLTVGIAGIVLAGFSSAASFVASGEAEAGALSGAATTFNDSAASANAAVHFGASSTATPTFTQTVIVSGKSHIWDALQLPSGDILFDERGGQVEIYRNGQVVNVATVSSVDPENLGGLMGMAIDPQYSENNYIYTCLDTKTDVRVVRWQLSNDKLSDEHDIVTGILRYNGARAEAHSGCQLGFGPDGNLWVGTGDAFTTGEAQSPTGLGGKVLRVDRDGKGVPGNQGGGYDPRIFNYGHRNIQGLAFFKQPRGNVYGFNVEHGPDLDDEVNELKNGNFGWDPEGSSYNEDGLTMTDLKKFPNAVTPIWKSGTPTQAPSGASIIYGAQWKGWDGAIAIGMLKAEHLKILRIDANDKVTKEEQLLQGTYGRIRTATQGAVDGDLYLTTDNGTNDEIIKLTPQ